MKYEKNIKENNLIAYTILQNAINNNKVPHAYLFSAQQNQKIEEEYLFVIEKLISKNKIRDPLTYPDLNIIDGSNNIIKKEYIVSAIEQLQQTSLDEIGKKFLVIKNIENSNAHSINALLKFIEEPTKNTYILITTNNLGMVLPTIKSRSQIIDLKPKNIENIAIELENNNIPKTFSKILSNSGNSTEELLDIMQNNFVNLYKNIINILKKSIKNNKQLTISLYSLMNKNNYKNILILLRQFFNDIWKKEQSMKISFIEEEDIIQEYVSSNFKFNLALEYIDEFISLIKYNVNFDLNKNKLIIQLKECYE